MKKGSLTALALIFAATGIGLAQESAVEQHSLPQSTITRSPEMPPLERPVAPYLPGVPGYQRSLPQSTTARGPEMGALELPVTPYLPGTPGYQGTTPYAPAAEHGPCEKPLPAYDGSEIGWLSADYMLLWIKNSPLHTPLATTGTSTGLGVLGASGTSVVLGNSDIDYGAFSAGRLTGGFWFGRGSCWGLETSGFVTERNVERSSVASSPEGFPVLARPVIDARTGLETAELISAPGIASGAMAVNSWSQLYGWELDIVNRVSKSRDSRFEWIGGFRFLHLDENLDMFQSVTLLGQGTATLLGTPSGTLLIRDRFDTRNDFYGPEIGARGEAGNERFFVNFSAKVALGVSHETGNITGSTSNGGSQSVSGGLLALAPNSGRWTNDEFAVVPEININVGYRINPLWRFYIGYNFLYWSDVARPGDQINRVVNPAFIPTSQLFGTPGGSIQPVHNTHSTDVWVQGVNFGMELRY